MDATQQLRELLQSYFNLRSAVLRKLTDSALSDTAIQEALTLSYEVLRRRRRDAAAWQPNEIGELATLLDLSNHKAVQLKTIARQIEQLPNDYRIKLLKMSLLSTHKLTLRANDWHNWKQVELERIAAGLERLPLSIQ
ncbi:MAG: hypothetical protein H7Z72_17085 [Bacteroidetes bacterium]|nr:hypothetical protein [Fibrella sp.]